MDISGFAVSDTTVLHPSLLLLQSFADQGLTMPFLCLLFHPVVNILCYHDDAKGIHVRFLVFLYMVLLHEISSLGKRVPFYQSLQFGWHLQVCRHHLPPFF